MIKNALRIGKSVALASLLSIALVYQAAAKYDGPALADAPQAKWASTASCCASEAEGAIAQAASVEEAELA